MIESKLHLRSSLSMLLAIVCTGLLYFTAETFLSTEQAATRGYMFIAFLLSSVTWLWIILIELRTKATSITIDKDIIRIKSFLGIGFPQKFNIDELDGFVISSVPNGVDEKFEHLYLIKNKRKIARISEFYHKNYLEIKNSISSKASFLGEERFDVMLELKEQLQ